MRTNSLAGYFIAASIAVCSFQNVAAQPEKAEACINTLIHHQKAVGISVAVVRKNKIIYTHSFGLKDIASNTPLSDDCIFRIASISKSFSATSVMQLVEAKKLSLNEDVSNLINFKVRNPKYPETVITLGMLLSHRSSINDSQGYFSLDSLNPDKNPNWIKCYNNYEPGKGYMYCNLNYNLTGAIIEKVSRERFDLYVKHHILDPLQVYGGYCVDSLDKSRFATIYDYNADSGKFIPSPAAYTAHSAEIDHYTMGYSTPLFSPTGGMKISAGGLATIMLMHSNLGKTKGKRIISKKSALQMQTPLSEEEGYGFAMMTTDKLIDGLTLKGHTGSAYGLYSAMFFDSKKKFGIVVISNGCYPGNTGPFNTVLKTVVNALYEGFIAK